MIFSRRALQRRLNELRVSLDGSTVDRFAVDLNRAGKRRVAAMWEIPTLHGLASIGTLRHEVSLPSGRRPDISFCNDVLQLTADVTTVSDDGLDAANPYFEFSELIENAKNKLGLPIGGTDLKVEARREQTYRGTRTVLRLPPRTQLREFVLNQITPQLRQQYEAGAEILQLVVDDDEIGLSLTIDPAKSPIISGSYAAYDAPATRDRNPLYNALKSKAKQVRGGEGLKGIIVGDGNCAALSERVWGRPGTGGEAIVREFLRQHSSLDFVLILTVRETRPSWIQPQRSDCSLLPLLVMRPGHEGQNALTALFAAMVERMPKPIMMPVNGVLRAKEAGFGLGHHGGHRMVGNTVRVSAREFMEVLTGLRTFADNGAKNIEAARSYPARPNAIQEFLSRKLREGRLPTSIEVHKTDENDSDDYIILEFSEPDPAIAPLR